MTDEPVAPLPDTPSAPDAPAGESTPVASAPDPWARWVEAGVDPADDKAFDAFRRGRAIIDPATRERAVFDVLQQDHRVRERVAQLLAPQVTQEPDQWGPLEVHPEHPVYQPQDYVPQPDAQGYVTQNDMQEMLVQQSLIQQLHGLEGLSDVQRQEVFDRAYGKYQSGQLNMQTLTTAVSDSLNEIRSLWMPAQEGGVDVTDAAKAIAEQHAGAPAAGVDTGVTPGSVQEPRNLKESAELARRILESQNIG